MSVNDLPRDYELAPLGTTDEIGGVLRKLFPDAAHYDGDCCLEGDDFWLQLSFGYPKEQHLRTAIGVRCNAGLGVLPILQQVCEAFEARLFDNQAGDFTDLSGQTASSMEAFSSWRDRVKRSWGSNESESEERQGSR